MTDNYAIELDDVWVQYRLRHAHHYNLKRSLTNAITRRKEEPEIIDALKGISLKIPKGARIGLTGPNGSGKSTLLSVMAGVLTPTHGMKALIQSRREERMHSHLEFALVNRVQPWKNKLRQFTNSPA